MAKRKTILIFLNLTIISITGYIFYWYYPSSPSSFLTEEEIKNEVNPYHLSAKIEKVQDIIYLDKSHVFVPYITTEGEYAASYWYYEKRKWHTHYVGTISTPLLVSTNPKDASTYHFIWNLHPGDDLQSLEFLLLKRRNYSVSNGVETYIPGLQMRFSTKLTEQPYGYVKLPQEFVEVLNDTIQLESAQMEKMYYNGVFSSLSTEFAWSSLDESGTIVYPELSIGGGGSGGGNSLIFVRFIGEDEELFGY
ncbi:hypothetical protein [Litchfieldia alkalitelluris]|uniref:hypothetical protein n=1 Tax=Litchfieldia alkalitelluris TaxID=304268 RepID=UPI0009981711|nr:hypothetical protein [Litchfieldia alkalitelluris]